MYCFCQKEPFENFDCPQLLYHLEQGNRLEKPPHCPDAMYRIMHKCWQYNLDMRPTFHDILIDISQLDYDWFPSYSILVFIKFLYFGTVNPFYIFDEQWILLAQVNKMVSMLTALAMTTHTHTLSAKWHNTCILWLCSLCSTDPNEHTHRCLHWPNPVNDYLKQNDCRYIVYLY